MSVFPGKYCYLGLAIIAVIEIIWIWYVGHIVDYSSLWPALNGSAFFIGILAIFYFIQSLAERNRDRLSDGFADRFLNTYMPIAKTFAGGMMYILAGWVVLRLLNHLTMTIPIPYADPFLADLDGYLPIDWNTYFEFVATTPWLVTLYDKAYTGLTILTIFAFMSIVLVGELEKARYFAITFTITAFISTTVGTFFPALGTVEHTLVNKDLMANFPYPPGSYFIDILERLRSGGPQEFAFNRLPGLTTFPSFHTAAGIVLVYTYRQTILLWPTVIYTVIMIAATPVYGGHYFVDLIFGTIVAILVCRWVEARWFPELYKKYAKSSKSDIKTLQPAE